MTESIENIIRKVIKRIVAKTQTQGSSDFVPYFPRAASTG
jgi:hypothetical protein